MAKLHKEGNQTSGQGGQGTYDAGPTVEKVD